jgi:hypothetical protein
VLRADAGRHAVVRRGVDGDGVGGPEGVGLLAAHERQVHPVGDVVREREADHPLRAHHEIDHLRRDQLRRADEVAFVLPILVVGDDDELARPKVGERLLDGTEGHDGS